MKKEVEKLEREGKKTGIVNVTAFQATGGAGAAEAKETTSAVKGKSTSKSPARGVSPTKGMTAEEKKQSLIM
jgi:hypothetical protein